MSLLGNPFAWPPSSKALTDGWAAVEQATAVGATTPRERAYIAAIAAFYTDAGTVEHRTRALAYEQGMEQLVRQYPDDREATIFYALALNATALPADKTYANQIKAAALLEKVFTEQPQHPGVAHYLIHSYDYPPLAQRGLDAARRYTSIAPSAPHALHMPSHIFTRLGLWQESIDTNRASAVSAREELLATHQQDAGRTMRSMPWITCCMDTYSLARLTPPGRYWTRSRLSRNSMWRILLRPMPLPPCQRAMPSNAAAGRTLRR
jgi:hypothetical protein